MNKAQMTKKIKEYIAAHKEMQGETTLYTDILKAERELGISRIYIVMVQGMGRVY